MSRTPARRFGTFSASQAVIVLLTAVVVILAGWLAYRTGHSGNSGANARSSAAPPIDVKGWQHYTTADQKLHFSYPPSWRLSDETAKEGRGKDLVLMAAPDGFSMTLQAAAPKGAEIVDLPQVSSAPVTFAGQHDYLLYYAFAHGQANSAASQAFVSTARNRLAAPETKTAGTVWDVNMSIANRPGSAAVPVAQLGSNPDFHDALLLLESAGY